MRTGIILGLAISAAVITFGSALIVRDGLLAIAREIRDKPMPELPDTVNIRAVTVHHATMEGVQPGTGQPPVELKLTIENMHLESLTPGMLKPGKATE